MFFPNILTLNLHYYSNTDQLLSEWCYWECLLPVIFSKCIGSLKQVKYFLRQYLEKMQYMNFNWQFIYLGLFPGIIISWVFFPKAKNFRLPKGAEIFHVVNSYNFLKFSPIHFLVWLFTTQVLLLFICNLWNTRYLIEDSAIQIHGVIQLSCLCVYLWCIKAESQENHGFMKLLS